MKAKSDSSWISQAVAALGPAQAGLLGRLTSEPRMKRVWRELGRRRRSDGARLYPVGAGILLLIEVLKLTKERAYVIPDAMLLWPETVTLRLPRCSNGMPNGLPSFHGRTAVPTPNRSPGPPG